MSTIKNTMVFVGAFMCLIYATAATPDLNAALVLDDFENIYGDAGHQTNLSSIKYWAQTGRLTGGDFGYWYKYTDGMFIVAGITSHDTLGVTDGDMVKINDGGVMHFFFKLDPSTTNAYPGGEVACTFFTDKDTIDLSKMTAITFKAKGTGTIRVSIMTHNVKDPPLKDWGYLSDSVKLTGTMSEVSIPVSKLKPAPYSKAAENNVTWDASKKQAFGFQIKAENSKEAEVYIDDIAFAGMKYSDIITQAASVNQSFNILPSYSNTTISVIKGAVLYSINQAQNISISLFNAKGCAIKNLLSDNVPQGTHFVALPKSIAPGSYFIRLNNAQGSVSHKFTIVK